MQLTRHFKRSWFILPNDSESKNILRKQFSEIRRQISLPLRKQAAHAAADILTRHELFHRSQHIACYFGFGDEFDTVPIMDAVWRAKKHCYLPVLTDENTLQFFAYEKGDALNPNRYSIQEPVNTFDEMPAANLDIVIVPLIAFDLQGHRLGTGGGYYDRTFSFIKNKSAHRPFIMGLAYAAQQEESLPHDDWDVPLASVLTEQQLILLTGEYQSK